MNDLHEKFDRTEFKCKCGLCNVDTVDAELLKVLIAVRLHFNQIVTISSGCRCKRHNKNVGGRSKSYHLIGRAADIVVANTAPEMVYAFLIKTYPDKYGLILYKKKFVHIDTRSGTKFHEEK